MFGAAVIALAWANSPWKAADETLWRSDAAVRIAGHGLSLDLRHVVNDGLMTLFFFVVGLEIKRESPKASSANRGELASRPSPRSADWPYPPRYTSRSMSEVTVDTVGVYPWRPTLRWRSDGSSTRPVSMRQSPESF